jgi:hypothetical protein
MQKIIEQIISETWKPLLVTIIEVLIIAGVIFAITNFIPHSFAIISGHGFMSWVVAVITVRLLLYRSNVSEDFERLPDDTDEPSQQRSDEDDVTELLVPMIDSQAMPEEPRPPRDVINVKNGIYPFKPNDNNDQETSTRE